MEAYKNASLSVEERVSDLLSRMTPQEKARQLDQYFGVDLADRTRPHRDNAMDPSGKIVWERVEKTIGRDGVGCIHDLYANADVVNDLQKYAVEKTRLGIPILFSEEALHGLLRPGCTVFPQAIAQASSWDPEIARRIGRCIAAETRSYGIHETFSPVLDLARDPRWGRTEETYGEDTCLASRMGTAMIRGLQGERFDAPDSILAEPKHFAVHGVPEGGLNTSHCSMGMREMMTDFLPVFQAAFTDGGAVNAMCSYNAIDGIPCPSNRWLLTDLLRGEWKMPGLVRADLGAIARLQRSHKTADSAQDAIRQALEAGTDMQYYDYPHDVYQDALIQLAEKGGTGAEAVDTAVRRVLRVKFMLGLFENPYTDPALSAKTVRCAAHHEVALQAAREEICLLKNDGLLPLDRSLKKIAVIGPSADVPRLGDYTAAPEGFEPVTILKGVRELLAGSAELAYARGCGIQEDELEAFGPESLTDGKGNRGLLGEYFNGPDLTGEPTFTRLDDRINFDWAITKPDGRITSHCFCVRWTGTVKSGRSFAGRIGISSRDSMRLWVDGDLLADGWGREKSASVSIPFQFEQGKEYHIRLEYCRDADGAEVLFGFRDAARETEEAVRVASDADAVIVALGDSERTCGEGIDRSELGLPGRQEELLRAVYATGTPVVLVLQNGRPVTLEWESEHIPAILEAWYPGEQGGRAIAEAIFGVFSPAGRLPVSFPKSVGQIPVYYSRRRGGAASYIDRDNRPRYPFGHGLSYTEFSYENLRISPERIAPGGSARVTFDVVNTGQRTGDEVAQIYVSDTVSSVVQPEKLLKRFFRFRLEPGERKTVTAELGFEELKLLDASFRWTVEKGEFLILVGSSSKDIRLTGNLSVV